ncbi:MAG: hypothetical protein AB8B69_08665, partial [Chitinophagales bacterium]
GAGNIIQFLSLFAVITSVVYFFLAYYLINIGGLSGAILSLPLTHILLMPIWLLFVQKFAKVKLKDFLLAVWKGQWVALVTIFLFAILIKIYPALLSNYISLIVFGIICVLELGFLSWHYTIDSKVKELIFNKVNQFLKNRIQKIP